jgi:hypothetical protein
MAAYLEPYRKNLETLLHKEGTAIDQYLTLVEKKTGVKRVYAVFGKFTPLICINFDSNISLL